MGVEMCEKVEKTCTGNDEHNNSKVQSHQHIIPHFASISPLLTSLCLVTRGMPMWKHCSWMACMHARAGVAWDIADMSARAITSEIDIST
jgi:hypothetical protein